MKFRSVFIVLLFSFKALAITHSKSELTLIKSCIANQYGECVEDINEDTIPLDENLKPDFAEADVFSKTHSDQPIHLVFSGNVIRLTSTKLVEYYKKHQLKKGNKGKKFKTYRIQYYVKKGSSDDLECKVEKTAYPGLTKCLNSSRFITLNLAKDAYRIVCIEAESLKC